MTSPETQLRELARKHADKLYVTIRPFSYVEAQADVAADLLAFLSEAQQVLGSKEALHDLLSGYRTMCSAYDQPCAPYDSKAVASLTAHRALEAMTKS